MKTKLGISVGLAGAALYFSGLYSGYILTGLLVGYVLLFEDNGWLRKAAVKAFAIMVCFSLLSTVIYLLPNIVSLIDSVMRVFGSYLDFPLFSNLAAVISNVVDLIKKLLFIVLGVKALNQGNIAVPVVDKLIEKYMR